MGTTESVAYEVGRPIRPFGRSQRKVGYCSERWPGKMLLALLAQWRFEGIAARVVSGKGEGLWLRKCGAGDLFGSGVVNVGDMLKAVESGKGAG